jgi:RNA polymerase sigma factor (TIGR02999 family)
MSDEGTRIVSALDQGDPHAAGKFLPLVYEELHALAAQKLAQEKPGQTLQATALVHEACVRLVGQESSDAYRDLRHFFVAAALAMRHILIDQVRKKQPRKCGGQLQRQPWRPSPLRKRMRNRWPLMKLCRGCRAGSGESSPCRAALFRRACQ